MEKKTFLLVAHHVGADKAVVGPPRAEAHAKGLRRAIKALERQREMRVDKSGKEGKKPE